MKELTFYTVTYNVCTKSPNQSIKNLLQWESKNEEAIPDFCIFGFQEVKSQPQNLVLDSLFDDPWTTAIRDILCTFDFVKIRTVKMVGLLLNVFCRRKHVPYLSHMETSETRTGLFGLWGNKGAVSFSFKVYNTTLCFINCHLAPHEEYLNDRINNYHNIVESQCFGLSKKSILSHDYVFWFGDLNFRLEKANEFSSELISHKINLIELSYQSANTLPELWTVEELHNIKKNGRAFKDFFEPMPMFPPTYRFLVGSSCYDLKRRPAWTDRILYKSNLLLKKESRLYVKSYKHIDSIKLSDHKPVYGEACIYMSCENCIEKNKRVTFYKIQQWLLETENEVTLRVKGYVPCVNDWIGIYNEFYTSLDDYLSYVYLPSESYNFGSEEQSNHTNFDTSTLCRVRFLPDEYADGSKSICLKFSETSVLNPGKYILLYFSRNNNSVLGTSETFEAKYKPNPCSTLREFGW
ncbi:inositol polyphosphate 5-phosphatase K-like isoform X2 [Daktulosphaira vitifoliae]|uniref:inositol polyphosphate 5-phosphatase K-like isoform X2 n=1 Tax=Daktulosphaira vitifoliae TaxID=58002 RepID=UPI0021AA000F|nr:inositol polyphosphate 5-phosphatase K-like isoform X2 [Daktulosphaira vitifoliae]